MSHVPNAAAVASATAIIPKQLSSVRDEELRLVRELVAMVQAAKHTTDIQYELAAEVTDTSQQMHMRSRCHQAYNVASYVSWSGKRGWSGHYSTMPATATSTTEATPNGEVLRRRIYRILPKPSMSNEQGLQHAVTTSGVWYVHCAAYA
ncbi:unnamed protein product [Ceratitis capitata]|uniref:(Mediterranean fruit fly) hypothetical protein n=1 Tax=Ceratitis capitata TaxID=7213 RepID=A0A811V4V5_CERCA|nr:unnamed protein product [Ceratitis capitata]